MQPDAAAPTLPRLRTRPRCRRAPVVGTFGAANTFCIAASFSASRRCTPASCSAGREVP